MIETVHPTKGNVFNHGSDHSMVIFKIHERVNVT